jgi:8-oxo-dGTP pyrophosphatase MutT (NUDIX family)
VEQDGNGWVECALGHRHWGRHGAAGLLLHTVDDAGVARVLLQHRADWSHHGGTWGLPGGARDSHEDVVAAALREAAEETALDVARLRTRHTYVDDHGGWSYTTVYADTPAPLPTALNRESEALEWVPLGEVLTRSLHPGFAHTWSTVEARPLTLVVDAANVVGSRPDGWWKDRVGAAARLLAGLDALRAVTVSDPAGRTRVVARVIVVVEGQARTVGDATWATVVRAAGSGDDAVVSTVEDMAHRADALTVVTADRGLRRRVGAAAPDGQLAGPGWLLALLPPAAPR